MSLEASNMAVRNFKFLFIQLRRNFEQSTIQACFYLLLCGVFEMKIDDIKLICIKDVESGTWCVYHKNINGLVVQVDNLEDAPKELAKSFEVMLKYGFDKGMHEIQELDLNAT